MMKRRTDSRFVHAIEGEPNASSDPDFNDGPSIVPATWTTHPMPWNDLTRTWTSMARILSLINTCHLASSRRRLSPNASGRKVAVGFPSVISVAKLRSHTGRDLLSENDLDDLCEQRERVGFLHPA